MCLLKISRKPVGERDRGETENFGVEMQTSAESMTFQSFPEHRGSATA